MFKGNKTSFILSAAVLVAYVLVYPLLYPALAEVTNLLSLVPVVVAAWLFGMRGGLLVGVLSFPINVLLMQLVGIAERIRQRVECECSPKYDPSLVRAITVSLGVAPLTESVRTLDQLIRTADVEMYRAKQAGKNRVSSAVTISSGGI